MSLGSAHRLDLFGANGYGSAATGFGATVGGLQGSTGWNRPFFASEFGMVRYVDRRNAPAPPRKCTCTVRAQR